MTLVSTVRRPLCQWSRDLYVTTSGELKWGYRRTVLSVQDNRSAPTGKLPRWYRKIGCGTDMVSGVMILILAWARAIADSLFQNSWSYASHSTCWSYGKYVECDASKSAIFRDFVPKNIGIDYLCEALYHSLSCYLGINVCILPFVVKQNHTRI